jgi:hypothetical protein
VTSEVTNLGEEADRAGSDDAFDYAIQMLDRGAQALDGTRDKLIQGLEMNEASSRKLALRSGALIGGTGILAGIAEAVDQLTRAELGWVITTALFFFLLFGGVLAFVWTTTRPGSDKSRQALTELAALTGQALEALRIATGEIARARAHGQPQVAPPGQQLPQHTRASSRLDNESTPPG